MSRQGYEVLEAATGVEALEVMEREKGRVDIVVSDVVMPEMDGPTLLKELRKTKPDLKIIFVSGYPDDAFKKTLDENEAYAFLAKPFTLPQLAAKVKEQLGGLSPQAPRCGWPRGYPHPSCVIGGSQPRNDCRTRTKRVHCG